ncbi:MAG: pseudaminic acid cytidylyltransferase [Methanomethylovorans sp.]|uniref:pseudaminic acid cytidylyltransferase n=1 Tax=Methanomethylovorans sp. TaxID=2758717 RepID=UPI000A7E076A|nr:pseudaminic acid cytidylyltransferase [Methanomethylovorans sp.]
MIEIKPKSIVIVPARGGSKRIPHKNIKFFCGQPIIKYSIDAALESGCFDEIMVSTDDEEIAKIAKKYGAKVPFLRSEFNSNDFATVADVLKEVIEKYEQNGIYYNYLCCIFPTAPFISPERLKEAMSLLIKTGADCVLPVTRYSYPIQRALKIENDRAIMLWSENYAKRSQDLAPTYHDCGQFYCMRVESLLKQMKLFAEYTVPIILPESEVQDIDNEEDWKIAEIKYKLLRTKIKNY